MNTIYHTKELKEFSKFCKEVKKWEIVAVIIANFYGSSSYSYYFSVAEVTTVVVTDVTTHVVASL